MVDKGTSTCRSLEELMAVISRKGAKKALYDADPDGAVIACRQCGA